MLIATNPQTVMQDICEVFQPYDVPKQTIDDLTRHLSESPQLLNFVMQFQHCEEEPASSRALTSALTYVLSTLIEVNQLTTKQDSDGIFSRWSVAPDSVFLRG